MRVVKTAVVYGDFAVEAGVAGCELVAHCGGGCGVDGGSGVLVAVVVVAVVVLGSGGCQ